MHSIAEHTIVVQEEKLVFIKKEEENVKVEGKIDKQGNLLDCQGTGRISRVGGRERLKRRYLRCQEKGGSCKVSLSG